jgi:hypothetical protein
MSDFSAIRGVQVRRHEWLGSMPFRQDPWCILSAPCAALDVRVAQRTRPKVAGGSEAKRAKTLEIYRFDPRFASQSSYRHLRGTYLDQE